MENIIRNIALHYTYNKNLIHHPWQHSERVADLGTLILENEFGDDSIRMDVKTACYFHDTGRIRDRVDCGHGYRSAMILDTHKKEIPVNFDNDSVRYAILNHCSKEGDNGQLPVTKNYNPPSNIDLRISACLWDADRLDLLRLPNCNYVKPECLSTGYARAFANSPEHKKLCNGKYTGKVENITNF